ncbi:HAD family phosphatase [Candidatus Woesearchaeota archaeon]|nr:HAD family phosphatase [Candidatus Woesearchaeota archaeon]
MIKAVIFDMDGVLVNSIPFHLEIFKEVMAPYGVALTKEIFDEVNGMDTKNISKYLVERFSLDVDHKIIAEEKTRIVDERIKKGLPLFEGAKETLNRLKAEGFLIAIGTSSRKESLESSIGPYLPELAVDRIVTDADVKNAKPAPDIYLKCAEVLGLRPDECVVIEDAKNGITAAKRAGMLAIGITTTSDADVLKDADAIITSITDLDAGLIRSLQEEK